mmetsp:Transcript_16514/g.45507  ORF Transcript_16514/g.45507 Transcript_16514/m.45507 type:complete len:286 (-) Transcript_16514:384-1241(-)
MFSNGIRKQTNSLPMSLVMIFPAATSSAMGFGMFLDSVTVTNPKLDRYQSTVDERVRAYTDSLARPRSRCSSRTLRTRPRPMPSDLRSGTTYTEASSQSRGSVCCCCCCCFLRSSSRATSSARRSRRSSAAANASLYSFVQGRVFCQRPPEKSVRVSFSNSSHMSSSTSSSTELIRGIDPGGLSNSEGSTAAGPRGRICAQPTTRTRSPLETSSATTKFLWEIPNGFMSSLAMVNAMTGSSSARPHRNRTLSSPLPSARNNVDVDGCLRKNGDDPVDGWNLFSAA